MVFIRYEYQGMSAAPLPIQPPAPQISAPSPAPQRNSHRDNDASFNAHLHDAQQASSAKSDQSSQAADANAQDGGKSSANTQSAASSSSNATDSDSDSANSSTASLASSVLNLIADGESTGAAATKSAAGKTAAQASNSGQAPHAAPQTAAVPPLPPPPVPQTAASSKGGADTNGSVQASGDTANANGAATLTALQNALGTDDGTDDDADDADATSTSGLGGAAFQAVADSAQALAASATTAGHVASSIAAATPASTNSAQSTPDFASLRGSLDATAVATQPAGSTSASHSLSSNAPVGSSGFAKELGHQVTWLSGQEVKQAQIRLNPENLGPLDVKVSVEHGRVDVAFTTHHPETAAAVQQGLDQLNQMLGGQGLSLGHTSVGQHGQSQQFGESSQQQSSQTSSNTSDADGDTASSVLKRVAVGLVDAFA
jgi:flagellar hook-length control protein FliK